jgi:predicted Zn-dependent protease with MMP-like domain
VSILFILKFWVSESGFSDTGILLSLAKVETNIEAVCSSEAEVREQIRLTVIHELGHYFGMDENQRRMFSSRMADPVSRVLCSK